CSSDLDCCGPQTSPRPLGCMNGVCASEYPTESIVLCGTGCVTGMDPSDKVTHTISGHDTFSWGGKTQLDPVFEHDVMIGSPQTLTWDPGWINQEVIAFNKYYAGDVPTLAECIDTCDGLNAVCTRPCKMNAACIAACTPAQDACHQFCNSA